MKSEEEGIEQMEFTYEGVKAQLIEDILPFWLKQVDTTHGGFYGLVDENLIVDEKADKSGVLMSRYLWALSAAYPYVKDSEILNAARNVFDFIVNHMEDKEHEGIYWSVTYDGKPSVTQKHVYVQSFTIYALSEYYKISQDPESLSLAVRLFNLIEEKAYLSDENGYHEEFSKEWKSSPATLMGPKGTDEYFSTNTVLHLIEAYTNLYTVFADDQLLALIKRLLDNISQYIISPLGHCRTEFHRNWTALNENISYAHDIETAWLLYRTLEVINQTDETYYTHKINQIVESVVEEGLDKNGIIIDQLKEGKKTTTKQWWSLAESVIGFYDAFMRTSNKDYEEMAEKHWCFIQNYLLNPVELSEWYPHVDEDGKIVQDKSINISDAWKGPYHTVRMYVEMIDRFSR